MAHEETFRGDRNIYDLNWSDSCKRLNMSKFISVL